LALAGQVELRQLEIMAQTVCLVLLPLLEGAAEGQVEVALREDRAAAAETVVVITAGLARRGKDLQGGLTGQANARLAAAVLEALD
jgi:hypothetical protein